MLKYTNTETFFNLSNYKASSFNHEINFESNEIDYDIDTTSTSNNNMLSLVETDN